MLNETVIAYQQLSSVGAPAHVLVGMMVSGIVGAVMSFIAIR